MEEEGRERKYDDAEQNDTAVVTTEIKNHSANKRMSIFAPPSIWRDRFFQIQ
jgi:hypothetical protein